MQKGVHFIASTPFYMVIIICHYVPVCPSDSSEGLLYNKKEAASFSEAASDGRIYLQINKVKHKRLLHNWSMCHCTCS